MKKGMIKNPLEILAKAIYVRSKGRSVPSKSNTSKKLLTQLYPQENQRNIYDKYQIKKVTMMLTIIIFGIASATCIHLSSRMSTSLAEGARLIRNEWGAGDYSVILTAKTEDWSIDIPFLVRERQFSTQEKEELQSRLCALLPELIKGKNQDICYVTDNLNLVTSVQGYPFTISWNSQNRKLVNIDGKINRGEIVGEGEWVLLEAIIKNRQQGEYEPFAIKVYVPAENLSTEESFYRMLVSILEERDLSNETQEQIILPEKVEEHNLIWKEKNKDDSIFVLVLFLLGSVLVARGMDHDLKREGQKRGIQLMRDYAGFVNKLRLYLSAGLTVRNAFVRMTADYGNQQKTGKKQYLYEEMKIACFQLENGMSEEQVFAEWASRCGEMRYRRLSFLLGVHLKQGNNQLLQLLSQEADSAREDRRNYAKKAGEEAGTKLLLPMMIMLVVVMLLVMLPAYMDFGAL